MKVEAQLILGYNLAFRDNPQMGMDHLDQAIALYDRGRQRVRRLGIGSNSGVISLTVSALFLWMLGYPDRARTRAADAITLARKMNHPYTIIYALFHNGLLNLWLKNYGITEENAQAVLELAQEHGYQIWNAVGLCLHGAALVSLDSVDEGLAQIEQGIKAYRGLKTPPVFWPLLLHLCAGAYGKASKPAEGVPLMNEAIEVASASGGSGKTLKSEFLIQMGELLLSISAQNAAEVEALYQQAVDNAREVHTPMLELRAAMRLSPLWQEQGKQEQARKLLSDAYTKMTEGFTTHDMTEASALLADLS
jgi:predicted ATPase